MTKAQLDHALQIAGEVAAIVLKASAKDIPGTLDAAALLVTTLNFPKAVSVLAEIKSLLPIFAGAFPAVPVPPVSPNPAKS